MVWLLIVMVVFIALSWHLALKKGVAVGRASSEATQAAMNAELQVIRGANSELGQELKSLHLMLQDERLKSQRYFEKISGIAKERDEWLKLYTDQSIAHGNAQNMMLNTIEHLSRQLSAHGIKHKVPGIINEVRAEYVSKHESPARDLVESKKAPEAPQ